MRKTKSKKIRKRNRKILITIIIIIIGIFVMLVLSKKMKEMQNKTVETVIIDNDSSDLRKNVIIVNKEPEISSKVSDWDLILVNKENTIPENYNVELKNIEYGNKVDSRIADSLKQMLRDARKEGLQPYICSSYRTNNTQQILFNRKVNQYKRLGYSIENAKIEASYWVAIPGTSEHEIGLALDIVSKNFQVLDERQEDTAVQKWLMEHCTDYGFILRYPTDKKDITKISYEPWHYRYVGIENAKFMKKKNFCLEEYITYLQEF